MQEKTLLEDMRVLFRRTKQLYAGSLQAEQVKDLQQQWLASCSDHIQNHGKRLKSIHLKQAWASATAEGRDVYTLTHALDKLKRAIEDTNSSDTNNATAMIHAVKRALHLFMVRLES